MPELSFKKIQLDENMSLDCIFIICSNLTGFTFLQNNQQPFIGLLPKHLWVINSEKKCLSRSHDFSYLTNERPLNFVFENQDKISNSEFNGGYIGFISYDFAKAKNTALNRFSSDTPQAIIGEYDIFIKRESGQWFLFLEENINPSSDVIANLINQLQKQTDELLTHSKCIFQKHFAPRWTKSNYQHAFSKVQDYLHAGDCYQINLTQEFSSKISSGTLLSLLPELMELSQAPYAGYLAFDDFELLSCSPELFIEFDKDRLLKTRPIKGTLPRGSNPIEDKQLKQQLADSKKDQAENLMIVDLLRNDLSVYAETGSVKVPKLFEIESFAQVHHMVSEIHATLKPEVNSFDVLMSALPGGSITGAPKIRAMEIIDEIEGNNRGAYCGSLGYFNYDGTGRFNILIRSIQRYGDDVSVWAGGGITVASDVDAEYQETLDKVSAILDVLNQYAEKPNS